MISMEQFDAIRSFLSGAIVCVYFNGAIWKVTFYVKNFNSRKEMPPPFADFHAHGPEMESQTEERLLLAGARADFTRD